MKIVEQKEKTAMPAYTPPASKKDSNCRAGSLLEVTFAPEASTDKLYGNADTFIGHAIEKGDIFEYDMLWEDANTRANVDLEATIVQWRLRDDTAIKDQHGFRNHCELEQTLGGLAHGKFLKRTFDLSSASGKHINTLLFAANPGSGTKTTALFRTIRIRKGGGGSLVLWDGTQTLMSVYSYFAGKISVQCKSSYILKGSGTCRPTRLPEVVVPEGVDADADATAVDGEAEAVVFVAGEEVSCALELDLSPGNSPAPSLSVTGVQVQIAHGRLQDLPLALNESVGIDRHPLVGGELFQVDITFDVPHICAHPLLLDIYNGSRLTVLATVRDEESGEVTEKQLYNTEMNLTCHMPYVLFYFLFF